MSILDGPQQPTPMQAPVTEQQPVAQQPVASAPSVLDGPSGGQPTGGFLNDLGLDWNSVPTNVGPSDGTHRCFVTKSEVRTKQKDQSRQWVFTYRVADGEKEQGKTATEWRPIPNVVNGHFATEKDATNASWLKQRLLSLGVPESRVGSVTPGELQGIECYVTFKTNGQFQNVVNVKLASEVNAQISQLPQSGPTQLI